jgi:hypothetical protein
MSAVEGPIAYETRARPRQAVVAGLAGILLLASAALQAVGPQAKVDELTVQLIATNKRAALEVAGAALNAVGILGLGWTLIFLFRASRARKPEMSQAVWITVIAGAALAAIGGVAYGIAIAIKSHQFVTHGAQTYLEANSLLKSPLVAGLQYAGLIGSLLVAVAFVLVTLNAMRVGLLTKFLGYLGMAAAAGSLLLIGSAPATLIEVFWLLAVAYLFAGRWQGGDPPAWGTGRAEPWPTAAEIRQQRQRAMGGDGARRGEPAKPASGSRREPVGAASKQTRAPAQGTRATTPKRKRKRRK